LEENEKWKTDKNLKFLIELVAFHFTQWIEASFFPKKTSLRGYEYILELLCDFII
jgi:hypothetical protein